MNQRLSQQHPSLPPPDLEGAVDLASPVQIGLAQFKKMIAEVHGVAFVAVGMTGDSNIVLSFHAPGGLVQALGMLTAATQMVANRSQVPVAPSSPADRPLPPIESEDETE